MLYLAKRKCNECLTTRNRIVPGARAAEIIRECRAEMKHFRCHKGDLAGETLHCRGVHEIMGGDVAYQFAAATGIPIVEVDPENIRASIQEWFRENYRRQPAE